LDDVVVSGLEYFAAGDVPALDRCIAEVRESDVYILIVGHRYGFVPENHDRSITELEFDEARKLKKPVFAFILSDDAPVRKSSIETNPKLVAQLEAFKNRIRSTVIVSLFQSPDDLATRTISALRNFQAATSRLPSRGSGELEACRNEVEQHKRLIEDLSIRLKNVVPAQPIWRGRKFETDELLCFALLPFQEVFFEVYETAVAPAATSLGLRSLHAGEIFGNREVVEDIWDSICRSRLVIVDVTGRNPNVFYELGMCHTLGKESIIITQNKDDVPFDIRHRRYIEYSPDKLVKLKAVLGRTMQAILSQGGELSLSPR
jgi:hypothetical protein